MNLTALMTATRTRLGVPSTDAFYTDANVTDLVNAAVQYLSMVEDWPWLEAVETISCVNATDVYATAATAQRTIVLYDAVGIPLERKPLDELVHMGPATGANPRFFGYRGASLVLRPVPSSSFSLTHVYVGTETRLVSGSDLPTMPQQWHDSIADYAAALGYLRAGDTTRAEPFFAAAERWVAQMRDRAARSADSDGGGFNPAPAKAAP